MVRGEESHWTEVRETRTVSSWNAPQRVGIDKTLQRLGIRQQLSQFIPRVVYFLLLMVLAKTASDALELTAISNALGSLFVYLPNLIAPLLLVVIGSAIAQFAGRIVSVLDNVAKQGAGS